MTRRTPNEYFEGIRDGLEEMIASLGNGKKLTSREFVFRGPPRGMSGKEIADLRQSKLNVSQRILGVILDVSPRTVQAWEQGVNTPSGPALRLLRLLQERPDILSTLLTEA